MGKAKEYRASLCADILKEMVEGGMMSLGANCYVVGARMYSVFNNNGYKDEVKESGYKWSPTKEYFAKHLREATNTLADEHRIYVDYVRISPRLGGEWRVVGKQEFIIESLRQQQDILTRMENFNYRLDLGGKRWQIPLPGFDIPQLGPPK